MRVLVAGPSKWKAKTQSNPNLKREAERHLKQIFESLEEESPEVGTSLQLGIDTMVAMLCARHLFDYHAILSCDNQDESWTPEQRKAFLYLLQNATSIEKATASFPVPGCINTQRELLNNWWAKSSKRILILLRYGPLSKTQMERIKLARRVNAEVLTVKLDGE